MPSPPDEAAVVARVRELLIHVRDKSRERYVRLLAKMPAHIESVDQLIARQELVSARLAKIEECTSVEDILAVTAPVLLMCSNMVKLIMSIETDMRHVTICLQLSSKTYHAQSNDPYRDDRQKGHDYCIRRCCALYASWADLEKQYHDICGLAVRKTGTTYPRALIICAYTSAKRFVYAYLELLTRTRTHLIQITSALLRDVERHEFPVESYQKRRIAAELPMTSAGITGSSYM